MGCFSCRSSSTFNCIRVVHLNGYIEDFWNPITVSQVTGNAPQLFLCTPAQLLSSRSLRPEAQLQLGSLYFLLPYSIFQSDITPVDLVGLVTRLTSTAKRSPAKASETNSISTQHGPTSGYNSPARNSDMVLNRDRSVQYVSGVTQRSSKARSWKPILGTIRERSFNSGTKSDLFSKQSEIA